MKISNARLQWHDDGMPYAIDYNDVYFSRDDAEGESAHVFLAGSRLQARWAALPPGQRFTIAELGFGSGLNFMQTVRLWQEVSPGNCRLHYCAFELHPLTHADMKRMHDQWPACAAISEQLLQLYPDHTAGCHRLYIADNVILDLYYGDATQFLANTAAFAHCTFDCWYLDGFSPAQNPQLWHAQLLGRIAALSRPGTTVSSYSVAGRVRQGLSAAGFRVEKLPGFGRKRHMLAATMQADVAGAGAVADLAALQTNPEAPWLAVPAASAATGHAIVIGAGLAGCSTARSLAARGWRVTVLERGPGPASGASGIPQMALRCRLFRQADAITDFFSNAFLFANREFNKLQARQDLHWQQCGVVQLVGALNRNHSPDEPDLQNVYAPQLIATAHEAELCRLAGIELAAAGSWLPLGGWLQPAALCAAYLDHPGITFHDNSKVDTIEQQPGDSWLVNTANTKHASLGGDIVIIANGGAALELAQSAYLLLDLVRGQISQVPATVDSQALGVVVNGARTIFPADAAGTHTLAASYAAGDFSLDARPADDEANLQGAAAAFKDPHALKHEVIASKVALRCNSSDRLPVVGRLAQRDVTVSALAALGRNARHRFDAHTMQAHSLYYPGLYINVAHGSNGLATCPLSAEILASLICNENLPCTGAVMQALNPIRFLIRNLKQQRINADSNADKTQ